MYDIFLSLKEKKHGNEVMQYIEKLINECVKGGSGTLYSILSRFEEVVKIQ